MEKETERKRWKTKFRGWKGGELAYIWACRPTEREEKRGGESANVIMHAVGVKFDPARWASNFRYNLAGGKNNNTVDDWLSCLPVMTTRNGGRVSLPPCFTRAQNKPRAESQQLSCDPSAFPFLTLFS